MLARKPAGFFTLVDSRERDYSSKPGLDLDDCAGPEGRLRRMEGWAGQEEAPGLPLGDHNEAGGRVARRPTDRRRGRAGLQPER